MHGEDHVSITNPVIRLGISTCLLGQKVRYDGGHKKADFLLKLFGEPIEQIVDGTPVWKSQYVEWVPVCPEVEIGLPVPREPVRLVGDPAAPRLIALKSRADHTDTMQAWASRRLDELAAARLCGFVFKSKSPSSGLFRVRVYDEHGNPSRTGTGMFPRAVMQRFPLLPLEEEGRLNDLPLRENFIERVFAYYRWTEMLRNEPAPGGLVRFHTAHKLTLMAHSIKHYQELGRLVAQAGTLPWEELSATYGRLFMEGLALLGTRRKHVNVLQHLMGYLKKELSSEDKQELLGLIEDYRHELVPLIVPLTLLQHHFRRHPVPDWLHQQVYLSPLPTS